MSLHVLDWRGGIATWDPAAKVCRLWSVLHYTSLLVDAELRIVGPAPAQPRTDFMRDVSMPLASTSELDRRSARLWAGKCACMACDACLADSTA
jgi:hypothetical protein